MQSRDYLKLLNKSQDEKNNYLCNEVKKRNIYLDSKSNYVHYRKIAALALLAGANPNQDNSSTQGYQHPIINVLSYDDVELAQLFFEKGLSIAIRERWFSGHTFSVWRMCKSEEMARLLLKYNIPLCEGDKDSHDWDTPCALKDVLKNSPNIPLIRYLLSLNKEAIFHGKDSLMIDIFSHYSEFFKNGTKKECIKLLIDYGENPHRVDKFTKCNFVSEHVASEANQLLQWAKNYYDRRLKLLPTMKVTLLTTKLLTRFRLLSQPLEVSENHFIHLPLDIVNRIVQEGVFGEYVMHSYPVQCQYPQIIPSHATFEERECLQVENRRRMEQNLIQAKKIVVRALLFLQQF